MTTKKIGKQTNVYAQVFNWPLDRILRISGIKTKPDQISIQGGANSTDLKFVQKGGILHVYLPQKQSDNFVSTILLQDNEPLQLDKEIVAESTFGGFSLNSTNTLNKKELKIIPYDGRKPAHIQSTGETIEWEVDFPEVGTYKIDVSAHNPTNTPIDITVHTAIQSISEKLTPNGKMVVEPNENNYTDEFVNTTIGTIQVDQTGKQKITFKTNESSHLWLNTMWIEKMK